MIERVVKRYLMHNQGDSDDPKLNELDEIKQEVQDIKYDILNDIRKFREDNMKKAFVLSNNLQYVTEQFLTKYKLINNITSKQEQEKKLSPESPNSSKFEDDKNSIKEKEVERRKIESLNKNSSRQMNSLERFRELCLENKKLFKSCSMFSSYSSSSNNDSNSSFHKLKHQLTAKINNKKSNVNNVIYGKGEQEEEEEAEIEDEENSKEENSNLASEIGQTSINTPSSLSSLSSSSVATALNYSQRVKDETRFFKNLEEQKTKLKQKSEKEQKNKMFEEFQNRLDFDFQIAYEEDDN